MTASQQLQVANLIKYAADLEAYQEAYKNHRMSRSDVRKLKARDNDLPGRPMSFVPGGAAPGAAAIGLNLIREGYDQKDVLPMMGRLADRSSTASSVAGAAGVGAWAGDHIISKGDLWKRNKFSYLAQLLGKGILGSLAGRSAGGGLYNIGAPGRLRKELDNLGE